MSKPVAGEWYEFCDVRVCCVAVSKQNDVVFEHRNGSFEFFRDGEEPLDDLKYLPDCTGWDWQPETFPQYYDHGLKGDRRNGTAFIRRDSVEKYACVSVDGCDKTKYDWNESCKYYVRCGTWKQITEQQALALLDKPQPAEDLPAKKRTVTVPKWLCRSWGNWQVLECSRPVGWEEVHRVGETTYEID